jgi:16S rRNA (adenine1518-N6/adenine1519-N6)-dimethyltransferase
MNLKRIDLPALLKKHGLRPKKSLGQNFLWDPNILEHIVETAELPEAAQVLEIGAGAGTLTRHLAEAAAYVKAVEIDRNLKPVLDEVLAPYAHVELIIGDILKIPAEEIMPASGYYVIANIPYYITSALIRRLLEAPVRPARMVLTIQHEVARRICAQPGNLSLLALSVQVYGQPTLAYKIPAGAFYPAPDVDSAVLRVDLYAQPLMATEQLDLFFKLAKAGFQQKRKKMRNALAEGFHLPAEKVENTLILAGIDPASRAQMLDIQDWASLTKVWAAQFPKS